MKYRVDFAPVSAGVSAVARSGGAWCARQMDCDCPGAVRGLAAWRGLAPTASHGEVGATHRRADCRASGGAGRPGCAIGFLSGIAGDRCQRTSWRGRSESRGEGGGAFVSSTGVHVVRSREVLDLYPVEEYEDEYAQRLGNVPYTTDFFSALGTMLARRMWGVAENRYRSDCAGMRSAVVERQLRQKIRPECEVDRPHPALQRLMLEQRRRGDAALPLQPAAARKMCGRRSTSNPAMRLDARRHRRGTHLVLRPSAEASGKSCARSRIGARQLHIPPFGCGCRLEVEACVSDVLALQVPVAIPMRFRAWLKHVWAFDRLTGAMDQPVARPPSANRAGIGEQCLPGASAKV